MFANFHRVLLKREPYGNFVIHFNKPKKQKSILGEI